MNDQKAFNIFFWICGAVLTAALIFVVAACEGDEFITNVEITNNCKNEGEGNLDCDGDSDTESTDGGDTTSFPVINE